MTQVSVTPWGTSCNTKMNPLRHHPMGYPIGFHGIHLMGHPVRHTMPWYTSWDIPRDASWGHRGNPQESICPMELDTDTSCDVPYGTLQKHLANVMFHGLPMGYAVRDNPSRIAMGYPRGALNPWAGRVSPLNGLWDMPLGYSMNSRWNCPWECFIP